MRKIGLVLTTLIVFGLLSLIFAGSGWFNGTHEAYELSSGWANGTRCIKADDGCITNNLCLTPVPIAQKGEPLRYQRASAAACTDQKNPLALGIDEVIYGIVAVVITSIIAKTIWKPRSRRAFYE